MWHFLFLAVACSAGHPVQLALCSTPGSQRTPSLTWQTSPEPPSTKGQGAPPGGPAPTLLGCPSSLLSGGPVWGCATTQHVSSCRETLLIGACLMQSSDLPCALLRASHHVQLSTKCRRDDPASVHSHIPLSCVSGIAEQQLPSLTSPGMSNCACALQPTQSQTALAARTVSWNPANFSQAAGWLSEAGRQGSDAGRNSQADYAPGG